MDIIPLSGTILMWVSPTITSFEEELEVEGFGSDFRRYRGIDWGWTIEDGITGGSWGCYTGGAWEMGAEITVPRRVLIP